MQFQESFFLSILLFLVVLSSFIYINVNVFAIRVAILFLLRRRLRRTGVRLACNMDLQTLHYYRCVLYMYVYSIMTAGNTF